VQLHPGSGNLDHFSGDRLIASIEVRPDDSPVAGPSHFLSAKIHSVLSAASDKIRRLLHALAQNRVRHPHSRFMQNAPTMRSAAARGKNVRDRDACFVVTVRGFRAAPDFTRDEFGFHFDKNHRARRYFVGHMDAHAGNGEIQKHAGRAGGASTCAERRDVPAALDRKARFAPLLMTRHEIDTRAVMAVSSDAVSHDSGKFQVTELHADVRFGINPEIVSDMHFSLLEAEQSAFERGAARDMENDLRFGVRNRSIGYSHETSLYLCR
jgi:hypothetical protein